MIRPAFERPEINVVNGQMGCPSNASDIADVLWTVIEHPHGPYNTRHFVNDGEASWYDLAVWIFADMPRGLVKSVLNAIPSPQYSTLRYAPKQFAAVDGGDTTRFLNPAKARRK